MPPMKLVGGTILALALLAGCGGNDTEGYPAQEPYVPPPPTSYYAITTTDPRGSEIDQLRRELAQERFEREQAEYRQSLCNRGRDWACR